MLVDRIDSLIAEAMKSRERQKLDTLKLIKCELVKAQKDGVELNDTSELKILKKMVAARNDAAEQYKSAGRSELAENELKEIEIINEFLPKEASKEEVETYTNQIIDSLINDNGSVSMRDMKTILGKVQEKYPTADGKLVSTVLKTKI